MSKPRCASAHLGAGVLPVEGLAERQKDLHRRAHDLRAGAPLQESRDHANSHKVIRNLTDATIKAADELGVAVQCCQKADESKTRSTACSSRRRMKICWLFSI
ncbi:MAG: hypothetical protein FJX48_14480 [Alphaproteobacteria bacterium]|nr:hypothetical protein [Alphaproteobacteria bacterium]